jgi:hypothetical protein
MSEFTKEELQLIRYCIENISHKKFMADVNIQPLYLKLISIIDNYCDHPESYMYRYDGWINYCDKCKRMWKTKKDIE